MQNISSAHFDNDEQDSFDDLDVLFDHLECFEPPVDMVKRIMDAVSKLPPPQTQPSISDGQGGLIARYEDKLPS
jgi:hypothetical protein